MNLFHEDSLVAALDPGFMPVSAKESLNRAFTSPKKLPGTPQFDRPPNGLDMEDYYTDRNHRTKMVAVRKGSVKDQEGHRRRILQLAAKQKLRPTSQRLFQTAAYFYMECVPNE